MLEINYRDSRPIFEQLADKLRKMILSGVIAPGEKLPSVRELAVQLAINPNTIQHAYRELEQAGFICSIPGKGSFAGDLDRVEQSRRDGLKRQLADAYRELVQLGEDPAALLRELQEEFDHA